MHDVQLEDRLRTALRAEGDALPFTITVEELELRLRERRRGRLTRRSGLAAAAVFGALAVSGLTILLGNPRPNGPVAQTPEATASSTATPLASTPGATPTRAATQELLALPRDVTWLWTEPVVDVSSADTGAVGTPGSTPMAVEVGRLPAGEQWQAAVVCAGEGTVVVMAGETKIEGPCNGVPLYSTLGDGFSAAANVELVVKPGVTWRFIAGKHPLDAGPPPAPQLPNTDALRTAVGLDAGESRFVAAAERAAWDDADPEPIEYGIATIDSGEVTIVWACVGGPSMRWRAVDAGAGNDVATPPAEPCDGEIHLTRLADLPPSTWLTTRVASAASFRLLIVEPPLPELPEFGPEDAGWAWTSWAFDANNNEVGNDGPILVGHLLEAPSQQYAFACAGPGSIQISLDDVPARAEPCDGEPVFVEAGPPGGRRAVTVLVDIEAAWRIIGGTSSPLSQVEPRPIPEEPGLERLALLDVDENSRTAQADVILPDDAEGYTIRISCVGSGSILVETPTEPLEHTCDSTTGIPGLSPIRPAAATVPLTVRGIGAVRATVAVDALDLEAIPNIEFRAPTGTLSAGEPVRTEPGCGVSWELANGSSQSGDLCGPSYPVFPADRTLRVLAGEELTFALEGGWTITTVRAERVPTADVLAGRDLTWEPVERCCDTGEAQPGRALLWIDEPGDWTLRFSISAMRGGDRFGSPYHARVIVDP